jgi:hypothetical protein
MRNSKRVIIEKRMKIFTQVTDNRINLRMRFEKIKKILFGQLLKCKIYLK